MAETYQTKMYIEQGGENCFYQSGATLNLESGAVIAIAGATAAAADARRSLVSELGGVPVVIAVGAAISKLAISNVPRNARVVTIIGSNTLSEGSIWLTSVSAGRELFLRLVGDLTGTFTNNNASVTVLRSGCTILNSVGGALASFTMHTSNAADCGVLLKAVADDVWAIVGQVGVSTSVTEH